MKIKNLNYKKKLGNFGEELVTNMLKEKGFSILTRNYIIKGGEIDIIASKKDLLVFVEVKTRSKSYFALSLVITVTKQKKIIFTAKHFLLKNNFENKTYRFDVALIESEKITYIPNAFSKSE